MDTKKNPGRVTDNVVVSIEYSLTVGGEVVDTTEGDEPLQFLQGTPKYHPRPGARAGRDEDWREKDCHRIPEEAYGEVDPDNIIEVPRSEFPEEIPLEPGIELDVKNADGEELSATIAGITQETVKLDFNHPLAGKQLTFEVEIVDLREATEEELTHGHVHFEDDVDYEEEDDLIEYEEDYEYEDIEDEDESSEKGINN